MEPNQQPAPAQPQPLTQPVESIIPPAPQPTPQPVQPPTPVQTPPQPVQTTAPQPQNNEGSKSFMTAFILSLFLGSLGADRFYLGKIGTGVLKLLTSGGMGLWTFIDLILLLGGNTKSSDGKSLKGYQENKKLAIILFIIFYVIMPIVVMVLFGAMIFAAIQLALQQPIPAQY